MTTYNPNGNNWVSSDSMGKRLLIKAGWSSGEGLGKYKQGSNVHIKVSIKNEKDGIGLKSEKRENDLSLMQCFTFDNILKSKYGKSAEEKSEENAEKQMERGLSRARFGRAVPKEYFNPVQSDDLNKILCKSKSEKIEENLPEIKVKKSNNEGNANFFSTFSVFEYFSMKMKASNIKIDNLNGMIFNKLNTVENFRKSETNEFEGKSNEKEDILKKKKKSKNNNTNLPEKKRNSVNTKTSFGEEFTLESKTNEFERKSNEENNAKIAEKKKKSKKKDEKLQENKKQSINTKTCSEENTKFDSEIFKSKKKSSKIICNEEFEITNGKEIINNKINNEEISEEILFSETVGKLSKKKRKLSEPKEKTKDRKKKCIEVISENFDKDLLVTNIPAKVTKTFVNESMEIIENDAFCPWNTSNINEIEGYKYY